jgi:hypothetical protein
MTHDVFPWYLERFDQAFRNELDAFVSALHTGERELTPSVFDARAALVLGLAAKDSWRSGTVIEVNDETFTT